MNSQIAIDLYCSMLAVAAPCAFAIGIGNIIVNMMLNAFFNGKLKIGGKSS